MVASHVLLESMEGHHEDLHREPATERGARPQEGVWPPEPLHGDAHRRCNVREAGTPLGHLMHELSVTQGSARASRCRLCAEGSASPACGKWMRRSVPSTESEREDHNVQRGCSG